MFAVPVAVGAQVGVGVAAGLSAPLGDFGKAAESGYHATGLVTIGVPLLPVGARLEGSFSEFNYKDATNDAKARILYATANAVLSTPGIIGPYLIGGVGIYRATAECSTCTTESTKIGFNGGGGLKIGLAGFAVFVEARYHYIGGASDPTNGGIKSSTQFVPISVGLTF
jgi:opacity protein-like surface antigen